MSEELSSVIVDKAAQSLFNHRRSVGDPMWEDLDILTRGYYRRIGRIRIRQGITCPSVSPGGEERCVLMNNHRGRHERMASWD